ncbi:hypothetical protein OHA44_38355 (plasmid) [Streptomyces sp. NBC_00144]|uniref:hypothetical protein n=1 Tax=Streptomyces sp. NBC_00144 TaxID=2975665 RepID=UPI00324687C4
MPKIVMLVLLLLVLVAALMLGAMAYVAHRHPAFATPLLVAASGAAVLAACVVPIAVS